VPGSPDFADFLKKARLAAGLSQAELASRAGLTGSYVCLLESRRRPAPSPEVASALARALGVDAPALREKAELSRAPEPLRRRLAGLARERHRMRTSRDAALTTTIFHVARRPGLLSEAVAEALGLAEEQRVVLDQIAHRVREIPTAEQAESKAEDLLKDLPGRDRNALMRVLPRLLAGGGVEPGAAPTPAVARAAPEDRPWRSVPVVREVPARGADPARGAEDALHVDRRVHRPGSYFLVLDDDEAYPRVESGDYLLVDPDAQPKDGDWVVWRDGARSRARIFRRQGEEVRLESPRTDVPPLRMAGDRFQPAGVVVWIFRPLRGAPPLRSGRAGDAAQEAS
jgi:transcriptional regulator with XRE-family HTH domain